MNDIALLKLGEIIPGFQLCNKFTEDRVNLANFSPACLPSSGESFFDKKGFVYGEYLQQEQEEKMQLLKCAIPTILISVRHENSGSLLLLVRGSYCIYKLGQLDVSKAFDSISDHLTENFWFF